MSETVKERDFSSYELADDTRELADGLLQEIAQIAQVDLYDVAPEKAMARMIGALGPDKELQKNIGRVRELLGEDSTERMADWVDRSGILKPIDRLFVRNEKSPSYVDTVVFTGGVGNWILRRESLLERMDPDAIGRAWLPMGNRVMKPGEHQLVTTWARRHNGAFPTEAQFAQDFVVPVMRIRGIEQADVFPVEDDNGDNILDTFLEFHKSVLDGTIKVVANAPNTIQAAGQLRWAAVRADETFDRNGDQLSMVSDTIQVAREGESTATHQNPASALGQLARNALFIERNKVADANR